MNNLNETIADATRGIEWKYFYLPVHGTPAGIYRERVYCYELYHQMRLSRRWDDSFTLNGEVDKSGHPFFREEHLSRIKPDLLIHRPGYNEGNYCAIEVKPIKATANGLRKDLETLTALHRHANYQKLLLLVFGEGVNDKILGKINSIAQDNSNVDLSLIDVWWHENPGEPARIIKAADVNIQDR